MMTIMKQMFSDLTVAIDLKKKKTHRGKLESHDKPAMVVHACKPSTREAEDGRPL